MPRIPTKPKTPKIPKRQITPTEYKTIKKELKFWGKELKEWWGRIKNMKTKKTPTKKGVMENIKSHKKQLEDAIRGNY